MIGLAENILKKEISFGDKNKFPSKRSLNLCQNDEDEHKTAKTWIAFAIYLVCLALFVHFGVFNQLQKINNLESVYNATEAQLSELQDANSDYEEVRAEYSHYGNGYLNDEEKALQDRLDMIDVIEQQLLDQGALEAIDITGNTAELTINSEKLSNLSEIVANLESSDIVSYVTVSTSTNDQSSSTDSSTSEVLSTMTITFKDVTTDTSSDTSSDSTAETTASATASSTEAAQ